jgi:hypothetical protein
MTVREIITKYLKDNGYDGLCCEDCGCEVEDLAPCCIGENFIDCRPGYKVPCDPATCPADGDCGWHIATKKE